MHNFSKSARYVEIISFLVTSQIGVLDCHLPNFLEVDPVHSILGLLTLSNDSSRSKVRSLKKERIKTLEKASFFCKGDSD